MASGGEIGILTCGKKVLSVVLGGLVAVPWTCICFLLFTLTNITGAWWLALLPVASAGFIIPWGLVQLIARLILRLKRRRLAYDARPRPVSPSERNRGEALQPPRGSAGAAE